MENKRVNIQNMIFTFLFSGLCLFKYVVDEAGGIQKMTLPYFGAFAVAMLLVGLWVLWMGWVWARMARKGKNWSYTPALFFLIYAFCFYFFVFSLLRNISSDSAHQIIVRLKASLLVAFLGLLAKWVAPDSGGRSLKGILTKPYDSAVNFSIRLFLSMAGTLVLVGCIVQWCLR
jgi:hypothetical protein